MRIKKKMLRWLGKITGANRFLQRLRTYRLRLERHSDVTNHLASLLHCQLMLEAAKSTSQAEFAWVSPLPPMDTGIANFSRCMSLENPGVFDLFTAFSNAEEVLDSSLEYRTASRVLPVELLGIAGQHTPYRAVVFSIGNSDHNLFAARRLWSYSKLPSRRPIAIDIHDPCFYNLVRKLINNDETVQRLYRQVYGDRVQGVDTSDYTALRKRGITGLSVLLRKCQVDYLIVHSESAKKLVVQDFGDSSLPTIIKAFHPVFEPFVFEPIELNGPVAGSFGIPHSSKYLVEKVNALERLLRDKVVGSVVFAGFQARRNIEKEFGAIPPQFHIYESPTDQELAALMASTDVAIQLRRYDLGESSGVVPQLLRLGKTVVCNEIGAFAEYGTAVRYIRDAVSPDSIYSAIVDALKSVDKQRLHAHHFASTHSSAQFINTIRTGISDSSGLPPDKRKVQ